MIVVRAPLRISFVGGGTDLPYFYTKHSGKVISTAIDKYVYVVVNKTPLINKISARYAISETVDHPSLLEHTRIRAALLDLKIEKGIEIASFANLPAKTGLGSSSSFSAALLKGLYAYLGDRITKEELAEKTCRLEMDLVGEPIGKQDQYAATFGGFNIFEFCPDHSVSVKPILLNYKEKLAFENHLLIFFTGLTRLASTVLTKQKENMQRNFKVLRCMSGLVDEFSDKLNRGDFRNAGLILHKAWILKKKLTSEISNPFIDKLYNEGIKNGAWGGKILGAGGGGCILFIAPPEKKKIIRDKIKTLGRKNNMHDLTEIPVHFVQSGTEIIFNSN